LDSVIEGGFPRGSQILLAGEPGSGKTAFSAQFLAKGTGEGASGDLGTGAARISHDAMAEGHPVAQAHAIGLMGAKDMRDAAGEERMDEFRSYLLEAVDEVLLNLGESVRHAIYWHLKKIGSIGRDEIPDRPRDFASALEGIFGFGAEVLEGSIVERLYSKLGLKFEEIEGEGFPEYLEEAKRRWSAGSMKP
jgi:hypothetical protein